MLRFRGREWLYHTGPITFDTLNYLLLGTNGFNFKQDKIQERELKTAPIFQCI